MALMHLAVTAPHYYTSYNEGWSGVSVRLSVRDRHPRNRKNPFSRLVLDGPNIAIDHADVLR